jgi:hypothetical protein
MGTMDFLHRLSRFSEQLRQESVFPDSMELLNLENPEKTRDQSQPVSIRSLLGNFEIPHTKTMHYEQQLKLATASFLYHVGTAKRRYPWP